MPLTFRWKAAGRSNPNKKKCADTIGHECSRGCGTDQHQSPWDRQSLQLAKQQSNHERGLKRAHTAACFVHTDEPGINANYAPFQLRRDPAHVQRLGRNESDHAHQTLHDRRFDRRDPGDGDKDECDRKRKMHEPRFAADFPKQSQCDGDCDRGVQPSEWTPVRIPNFEETQRKQEKESRNRNQCSNCLSSSNF